MIKYLCPILCLLGIGLSSLYVFPSGLPQPADFILVLFSSLMVISFAKKGRLSLPLFFKIFFIFLFWLFSVSVVWGLAYQSFDFLRNPLFYAFNALISLSFFAYIKSGENHYRIFRLSVICALLVSGAGVVVNIGVGGRITGFFNNPNQLAYFSLLGISLIFLLYRFAVPLISLATLGMCAAIVGVFSAASLAAISGLFLLFLSYALANLSSIKKMSKVFLIVPFVIIAFFSFDVFSGGVVSNNISNRMDRMESKVDDIYTERNYDRIAAFPEYWLLGAGEGHNERFYPFDGGEIHSTFGNIFFSYGLVGLGLFLSLIGLIFIKAPFYVSVLISGPLMYSMTHMGSRTTFFWLMLMVAWYLYVYKAGEQKYAENLLEDK